MFLEQIKSGLNLMGTSEHITGIFDTYLEPGKQIPTHRHPDVEEIYYVLSGYGEMTIDREYQHVKPLDVVYIPPGAMHELKNTSTVPLRFITVSVSVKNKRRDMRGEK